MSTKPTKPKKSTAPTTESPSDTVRLHISPVTRETLDHILPASLNLPEETRKSIFAGAVETFPEKPYAFVTLPVPIAEKIKKKFNGTMFRGNKLKVEVARPPRGSGSDDSGAEKKEKKEKKKSKKRKNESKDHDDDVDMDSDEKERKKEKKKSRRLEGVLPGVELEDGRKVKRGWTLNKSEGKEECLFKTRLPANVASGVKDSKLQKEWRDKDKKKKNEDGTPNTKPSKKDATIREFAHNEKIPSFLRGSGTLGKGVVEYSEEKGWVDSDGNVIEPPVLSKKDQMRKAEWERINAGKSKSSKTTFRAVPLRNSDDEDSSASSSSSSSSSTSSSSSSEEDEAEASEFDQDRFKKLLREENVVRVADDGKRPRAKVYESSSDDDSSSSDEEEKEASAKNRNQLKPDPKEMARMDSSDSESEGHEATDSESWAKRARRERDEIKRLLALESGPAESFAGSASEGWTTAGEAVKKLKIQESSDSDSSSESSSSSSDSSSEDDSDSDSDEKEDAMEVDEDAKATKSTKPKKSKKAVVESSTESDADSESESSSEDSSSDSSDSSDSSSGSESDSEDSSSDSSSSSSAESDASKASSVKTKNKNPNLTVMIPTIPIPTTRTAASPPSHSKIVPHALESLFKPTTTTLSKPFTFSAGPDTPLTRQHIRSGAPTPDTAVPKSGTLFSFGGSDIDSASSDEEHAPNFVAAEASQLPPDAMDLDEPIPIASKKSTEPDFPLLFSHDEDPFLHGLSIWSKLPKPKSLTQRVADELAEEAEREKEAAEKKTPAKKWGKKESVWEKEYGLHTLAEGPAEGAEEAVEEAYYEEQEEAAPTKKGKKEKVKPKRIQFGEDYDFAPQADAFKTASKSMKFEDDGESVPSGGKSESGKEGVWRERFFHFRGEWNRAWKRRMRNEGKRVRKKEGRVGGGAARVGVMVED